MSRALLSAVLLGWSAQACSQSTEPAPATRTYRMGFTAIPPRPTTPEALTTIEKWRPRGDAALMLVTPPWKAMLADTAAAVIVRREYAQLADLYRSRGQQVVVMIDATNGLKRDEENADLLAAGHSLSEPAMQALYKDVVLAVDTIIHPMYLGIAMETNLIRAIAPASIYASVKAASNASAAALRASGSTTKLFISVQVETAWGKLPVTNTFAGVAQDRADFPFMDAMGLSSYPNLTTVAVPEDLPLDYYERLAPGGTLPMLVVEGGWASSTIVHPSSPEMQARYIKRQMEIADSAKLIGVFQLTFTDMDLTAYGSQGSALGPFSVMGLMTADYADKPALAEWDKVFARPLKTP